MAKFLKHESGRIKEDQSVATSAGAGDAGKLAELNASGKFDNSFLPVGIGAETFVAPASENLAAGDIVNVYNNGGALNVRKADATTEGSEASGFVLSAVTSGANATVYFEQLNDQVTFIAGDIGGDLWLSTTAGTSTTTPPSASGNVVQKIGKVLSTSTMSFLSDQQTITLV